jgi:hypothetical protein
MGTVDPDGSNGETACSLSDQAERFVRSGANPARHPEAMIPVRVRPNAHGDAAAFPANGVTCVFVRFVKAVGADRSIDSRASNG